MTDASARLATALAVRPDGGFVFMRSHAGAGSSATQPPLVMAEQWFTELESRFVR